MATDDKDPGPKNLREEFARSGRPLHSHATLGDILAAHEFTGLDLAKASARGGGTAVASEPDAPAAATKRSRKR